MVVVWSNWSSQREGNKMPVVLWQQQHALTTHAPNKQTVTFIHTHAATLVRPSERPPSHGGEHWGAHVRRFSPQAARLHGWASEHGVGRVGAKVGFRGKQRLTWATEPISAQKKRAHSVDAFVVIAKQAVQTAQAVDVEPLAQVQDFRLTVLSIERHDWSASTSAVIITTPCCTTACPCRQ